MIRRKMKIVMPSLARHSQSRSSMYPLLWWIDEDDIDEDEDDQGDNEYEDDGDEYEDDEEATLARHSQPRFLMYPP